MGQGTTSQLGYAHVTETLCRDSVALHCVMTEKAMWSNRPGWVRTTRLGAHDIGILSRQTSYNGIKKKSTPLGF